MRQLLKCSFCGFDNCFYLCIIIIVSEGGNFMNYDIILTPMQISDLEKELVQSKLDLENAQIEMKLYKDSERFTSNCGDVSISVFDDSYYQKIAELVTKIDEIETLLANSILAEPTGNTIQVGSVVELADHDVKFMVVQKKVTSKSSMMEVSMDTPIFGAIYMHKVGDICEYTVNGKTCKCVIGKVDNNYSNNMAKEVSSEAKVK